MVMNLEEAVLKKLRELSPEQQKKALKYLESLKRDAKRPKKGKSLHGLWADLDFDFSEEQIAEARQEMWGNFPRDRG